MFWNKKKTDNEVSLYKLTVGHDRYGNLIIKELTIRTDDVDELMVLTQKALQEFNEMKVTMMLEVKWNGMFMQQFENYEQKSAMESDYVSNGIWSYSRVYDLWQDLGLVEFGGIVLKRVRCIWCGQFMKFNHARPLTHLTDKLHPVQQHFECARKVREGLLWKQVKECLKE